MRVLLVEDNPALAHSLNDALTNACFTVDCMPDGEAADHVLHTQDYALVILDLGLPKMHGLEVLKRLRQRRNRVPVLILTAHDSLEERVRGLDLGADDYLGKPVALIELEARARALIRRSHGYGDALIRCGTLEFDSIARTFMLADQPLSLTPRERSMLEALILRNGRAISKEALLEKIYGLTDSVNAEVIEIYVHRVRKKFEGSQVAITTLRGLGYLLEAKENNASRKPTGSRPKGSRSGR
jgi:two-component system response regulator TctD